MKIRLEVGELRSLIGEDALLRDAKRVVERLNDENNRLLADLRALSDTDLARDRAELAGTVKRLEDEIADKDEDIRDLNDEVRELTEKLTRAQRQPAAWRTAGKGHRKVTKP
jgi:chromosome segregation ATPase